MKLSVVIPAYDEAANIAPTVTELLSLLSDCDDVTAHEIVVVDDHSSDGTFEAVEEMGDDSVHCIRLSRRSGSHVALRAGLAHATGEAVLCISADGQDSPDVVSEMVAKWQAGSQIIWGLRTARAGEALRVRLFSGWFYRLLSSVAGDHGQDIDLSRADFFMLDRVVVDGVKSCPERNTSLFGMLAWIGFQQDSVEYERRPRRSGRSKWSFRSRLQLATDWIIAFSPKPLRMITRIGIILALVGIIFGAYVGYDAWWFASQPGWAIVLAAVTFIGGLQLVMLGLIGEYLWRALDEARDRKLYFVEKSTLPGP